MLDQAFDQLSFLCEPAEAKPRLFCLRLTPADAAPLMAIGLVAGQHRILLSNHGARLLAWKSPGGLDVLVAPRTPRDIFTDSAAMGVVVGRVCNRIAKGQFTIDNQGSYQLPCNDGAHHLHGGPGGFHTRLWTLSQHVQASDHALAVFSLNSAAGDQAYPGQVDARVTYILFDTGELSISFQGQVSGAATPLNFTHHAYWNLDAKRETILDHRLQSDCDRYLETDPFSIPSGRILAVEGGDFDFRRIRTIGLAFPPAPKPGSPPGFDHFLLRPGALNSERNCTWQRLATVHSSCGKRQLELWSDQWGFQFYTGNHLTAPFQAQAAFCLEPSALIDAVHHPHFPSIVVQPGQILEQRLSFLLKES